MGQQPEQNIKNNDRPRVADMDQIVHGRPAHIHSYMVWIDWGESLFRARKRIVQIQSHENCPVMIDLWRTHMPASPV